jgi:hypothetical protein
MGRSRRGRAGSTVRASRVEIVDGAGQVRAALGELGEGAVGLAVYDDTGATSVYVALDPTGPVVALGSKGTVRVEIGVQERVHDLLGDGGPYAFLAGPDGEPLRELRLGDTTDGL